MIGIVVSRADDASVAIGEALQAERDWSRPSEAESGNDVFTSQGFELRYFDDWHLDLTDVATAFHEPDVIVFASRHSGDTGPLLTTHFTGNFGSADAGGRPRELAAACPHVHATLFEAMIHHAPDGYRVGIECTHHGPSQVGAPSLFAEIGSGPEQWRDGAAATALARAILELGGVGPHREKQFVGFGGGHYAPRFERIIRDTDWAVGHIAADWSLDAMGTPEDHPAVLQSMFEQSAATVAVCDGDFPSLDSVIESLGYQVVSETWIRTTSEISLELVARIEERLGSIDSGVRFGETAVDITTEDSSQFDIVDLPDGLLEKARTVDREAVAEAVSGTLLAYTTVEGATKAAGRGAVRHPSDRAALLDALVSILERDYAIRREPDAIVVTERRFDPQRARQLGIEEGPLFGALAAGESVTIDGRTIEPAMVHEHRSTRYPI